MHDSMCVLVHEYAIRDTIHCKLEAISRIMYERFGITNFGSHLGKREHLDRGDGACVITTACSKIHATFSSQTYRARQAKETRFSSKEIDAPRPLQRLNFPLFFVCQQSTPHKVRIVHALSHVGRRQRVVLGSPHGYPQTSVNRREDVKG